MLGISMRGGDPISMISDIEIKRYARGQLAKVRGVLSYSEFCQMHENDEFVFEALKNAVHTLSTNSTLSKVARFTRIYVPVSIDSIIYILLSLAIASGITTSIKPLMKVLRSCVAGMPTIYIQRCAVKNSMGTFQRWQIIFTPSTIPFPRPARASRTLSFHSI